MQLSVPGISQGMYRATMWVGCLALSAGAIHSCHTWAGCGMLVAVGLVTSARSNNQSQDIFQAFVWSIFSFCPTN